MTKAIPIIDIFTKPDDDTSIANVTALSISKVMEVLENEFNGDAAVNSCDCNIWAYKNNDIATSNNKSASYSGAVSNIGVSAGNDLAEVLGNVYGQDPEVDRITIVFVFIIEE